MQTFLRTVSRGMPVLSATDCVIDLDEDNGACRFEFDYRYEGFEAFVNVRF